MLCVCFLFEKLQEFVRDVLFCYLCVMFWLLVIGVGVLVVAGVTAYVVSRRHRGEGFPKEIPSECCGEHAVCERDTLLLNTNEVIYFDDEELDIFRGMSPEDYSAEALRAFEEVFYTMREEDVAGWLRSLQLRGIALPAEIKEQALLIVRERRHLV